MIFSQINLNFLSSLERTSLNLLHRWNYLQHAELQVYMHNSWREWEKFHPRLMPPAVALRALKIEFYQHDLKIFKKITFANL